MFDMLPIREHVKSLSLSRPGIPLTFLSTLLSENALRMSINGHISESPHWLFLPLDSSLLEPSYQFAQRLIHILPSSLPRLYRDHFLSFSRRQLLIACSIALSCLGKSVEPCYQFAHRTLLSVCT